MSENRIITLMTSWGGVEPFLLVFSKDLEYDGARPLCPRCLGKLRVVGRKVLLYQLEDLWAVPTECEDCGDLFAVAGFVYKRG